MSMQSIRALIEFGKFISPKMASFEVDKYLEKNGDWEEVLVDGVITDQSKLKKMSYGDSNVGKSGCEAVAVYNILRLKGRQESLTDIIADIQICQAMINRGKWGTDPFLLPEIMDEYEIEYEPMFTLEEAREAMEEGDLLFVTMWNHVIKLFRGMHGYIIRKNSDTEYEAFNRQYSETSEKFSSLEEVIGEGKYVIGYLIR